MDFEVTKNAATSGIANYKGIHYKFNFLCMP